MIRPSLELPTSPPKPSAELKVGLLVYSCMWAPWQLQELSSHPVARLRAVIIGAALSGGAGGLIGSILAKWVGDDHAHHLQQQVDNGGLLLWVRTWTSTDEERAMSILTKHSGEQAHIHALPAAP